MSVDSFKRQRGRRDAASVEATDDAAVRFEGLVREHHRSIHAHVRVCYPNAHGEAVVNAVFTLLWQHLDDIPPDAVRTWLRVAARHEVLNASRQQQRWYALGDRVARLDPTEMAHPAPLDDRMDLDAVMSALSTLAPADRDVIVMVAVDQLSINDLALILGIEPDAAKTRLSRARGRLRAAVQRMEQLTYGGETA